MRRKKGESEIRRGSSTEKISEIRKAAILDTYQKLLNSRIQHLDQEVKNLQARAREAPTFAQTASDTSKNQLSRLALATEARLRTLRQQLASVASLKRKKASAIEVGALFQLKDVEKSTISFYLLVPGEGGDEFNEGGVDVTSVSPETPIVRALTQSKVKVGKTFSLGQRKFKLLQIE